MNKESLKTLQVTHNHSVQAFIKSLIDTGKELYRSYGTADLMGRI